MAVKNISESKSQWLYLFISILTAPCLSFEPVLNCSEPSNLALLEALTPVMKLSSIRPVIRQSTPTNVSIWFTLYGILGVDEKAQVLTTYIWLNFVSTNIFSLYTMWENLFFSWDPVKCGTNKIALPRKMFWVPDIVINEFMNENSAPPVPYIYLFNTGKVRDAQPVRVVSSCSLNIYTFPFDIQNCSLTFSSYIHHVADIKVRLQVPVEEIIHRSLEVMTTMGEWELLDIKAQKGLLLAFNHSQDPIDVLAFYIVVRRRATLYVVNLLIPSSFLITVDLFSFLLPPQSVDRSSFKMTLILGYTVFLLIMNDLLPVTGNTIPLINVFFSICLALMVASLLETVIITNLLCSGKKSPVPRWVQVVVLNIMGWLVCLPQKPSTEDMLMSHPAMRASLENLSNTQVKAPGEMGSVQEQLTLDELRRLGGDLQAIRLQVDQHLKGDHGSDEWIQVGYVVDRLLFGLYIAFICVSFITIICIWVTSYKK
ncbi:5-hydroxytryptamine receptor 3E-like [Osmerus eperlanus]|uniref:5-hydroxytryptamine receptor 3E-like n=1 Tax=Osmerus eperlanus TaxID=29151 RepID=UPI002E122025